MSDESVTGVRTPKKPMPATRLARVVLAVTGLIWVAIGVVGFGWPDELGRTVNLVAIDGLGSLELRAMYGGLSGAIGALHLFAVIRRKWLQPGLFCSAVVLAGLVAGRVTSCVIAGVPGPTALFFIGLESAGCTALVVAMWRLKMAERALRKRVSDSSLEISSLAPEAPVDAVSEAGAKEQGAPIPSILSEAQHIEAQHSEASSAEAADERSQNTDSA
ncbi:MAG TPA: hypothetical protein DCQ06_09855 [Myxococcales bacterium]|nr:hypothetical protein [Myxococcales bacterium]